ncbi:unnamed protein product [Hydatigera taeniaeformis]|uniref:Uncharacterized protein n=1 Tax=Hydatigena taeniaeformis TaxID=6205 RepID=A0A3P7FJU2_HYDTA|nr:unnamed protein product [Hydatigera taeniaeformis]
MEEKVAEYAKYIAKMKCGILNRLELAECQTQTVIDSHSSRLTEARETISRLTSELEHTRKRFEAESQQMKERVNHFISTEMVAEAKAATKRLQDKEAQSAASAAHSAEMLAEAQQKASRHAARATNLVTVVERLRGQFAEAQKNRDETQEVLKKMTEKSLKTESLLISAKRRCEDLTVRVEDLETENGRLKDVIKGSELEISRLKQATSNACNNSEHWQHEYEKANTKVKELTAALISASAQRESAVETERVAELQVEVRALRQQAAEFVALQAEATEARAAEEADRLHTLRSCIEHELRPHLNSADERSDCLFKRVDFGTENMLTQLLISFGFYKEIAGCDYAHLEAVSFARFSLLFIKALCQERDMLLLQLSEQQSMEKEWESFLDGIESLIDRLVSSVRHEEKVMKYEMAIQKSANEKLVQELKVDKVQIDTLTADRNALWRSLKERTNNVECWNRDMGRLQEELAESRKNLHSVTKERETALASLRQVEQCLDEQKEVFCERVRELEKQVKIRECELQDLKCISDKKLFDLEAELAKERMEKEALIATELCAGQDSALGYGKATGGPEIEELRAQLAERDAEMARLEVLSQERAQLIEKRAAELADLNVGGCWCGVNPL